MSDAVIAIDGPAASGKSTVAGLLANRLGAVYVNTGNMFRAVTLAALRENVPCEEDALKKMLAHTRIRYAATPGGAYELELNGEFPGAALRAPEVAAMVSPVAAVGCVREYLKELQREFAGQGLIVMEGRDIGTVIFPNARWKFFVTATPEERARRRLAQSGENFDGATLEEVAKGIAERDRIDSQRAIAPLKPAPDAEIVDTTGMTIDEVVEMLVRRVTHDA